jgi:sugar lactone lactonase YvrE
MALFTHLLRDLRQIVYRDAEQHAIPSMDGALSPNDRLDSCHVVGAPIAGADDLVEGEDGALYVSGGRQVLRLAGEGFQDRSVFAEFDGKAGGLALHPDGRLLVCVAGHGLAAVDAGGRRDWLVQAEDQPLHCLTGVAAAPDGTIFMTDGSLRHGADAWVWDLMEKNHLGRLVACGPGLDAPRVLRRGLHYPHGAALAADGRSLWFTESWSHRVSRAPIAGGGIGEVECVIHNLPGYPARLGRAAGGGFWLALFARRTHLVEFVLREDDYRAEMMQTVPPEFWISPALRATGHCLEPMQSGSVKALGIHKPWAPPRAYGLVVRIDAQGDAVESLHSRVGGRYHGITAAADTAQGPAIVSKGHGAVLLAAKEARR